MEVPFPWHFCYISSMDIIITNRFVFTEVARMLKELCAGKPEYADTVFILGHVDPRCKLSDMRKQYPNKKLIVYQLEQMYTGCKFANKHCYEWLTGADEIWDYDLDNIEWLAREGIRASFHPLRYVSTLRDIPVLDKDVDVLFYGAMTPRRCEIMAKLGNRSVGKWTTAYVLGVAGESLARWIGRSKIILNIHAYDNNNRQEQVRMFYPVINGACVVSEESARNYLERSIVECPLKYIPDTISDLLKGDRWKEIGENAAYSFMRR